MLDLDNYIDGKDYGGVQTLYVQAYRKNGSIQNIIDLVTIPFTMGNSLADLAQVVGDQVFINDGKVIAGSIATEAVTAGTIAAGAVTAYEIDANAIEAKHISTGAIETKHISGDAQNGLILSAINSINIHNNNLLRDSKGPFVLSAGTDNQYYKEFSFTSTSGDQYVFSADVTVNSGAVNKITFELRYKKDNGMIYSTQTKSIPSDKRIIFQFTDESANYEGNASLVGIRVYAGQKGQTSGKVITLKKVQLEKGNVATGWSPHPDDPASALETSYISIQTDKINIATGGTISLASGSAIHLATGGTITMDSKNFSVDADGNVSVKGVIEAESGKIGNWNIADGALTNGNATIGSDGSLNINDKFKVSKEGVLEATGANISGTISATEGTIGNWSISSGSLTSGKTTLNSDGGIDVNGNFIVDESGNVYLNKVYVESSEGVYSNRSLSDYPLWAIGDNYQARVTGFSSTQADDGTVTLTLKTKGKEYEVNFKKATGLKGYWNGARYTAELSTDKDATDKVSTLITVSPTTTFISGMNVYADVYADGTRITSGPVDATELYMTGRRQAANTLAIKKDKENYTYGDTVTVTATVSGDGEPGGDNYNGYEKSTTITIPKNNYNDGYNAAVDGITMGEGVWTARNIKQVSTYVDGALVKYLLVDATERYDAGYDAGKASVTPGTLRFSEGTRTSESVYVNVTCTCGAKGGYLAEV